MSVTLLDVNVLIALAWTNHPASARAHDWMDAHAASGWATCTVTQLGFIRLSLNATVVGVAISTPAVLTLLQSLVARPGHVFWPDVEIGREPAAEWVKVRGHRQVTDLYLASLAKHHGGRLVTFDRAAANLLPSHVEVI